VQALSRAQAQAFVAAVEALPAVQREAFLLHVEADMTVEEVAQATGVGFETAKSACVMRSASCGPSDGGMAMNNGETNTRDQRVVGAYRAASESLDERPQAQTRATILAAATRAVDAQRRITNRRNLAPGRTTRA